MTQQLQNEQGLVQAAISLRDLSVGYVGQRRRPKVVLSGLKAELLPGQFTFLLGPNGAGKSTLLRTVVGSQKALGGQVFLDGQDLATLSAKERAKRMSVVLTDRIDVGLMSVATLVGMGRAPYSGLLARHNSDDKDIIAWAIQAAGATALTHRMVHELSDGERQRAMIARALAQKPRILVLDEPTAFLDLTRRVELTALLQDLVRRTGLAVLMSTHDLDLALRLGDQIWLVHGDGHFDTGAPEDLALSGVIARGYAGKGIAFDHAAGTFIVAASGAGTRIAVAATGEARFWADRVVLRAGYVPVPEDSHCHGRLTFTGQDARWHLHIGPSRTTGTGFSTLHAALTAQTHYL